MSKTFAEICETRKHCYRCLNKRESFIASIKVEGKPVGEFTCPHGKKKQPEGENKGQTMKLEVRTHKKTHIEIIDHEGNFEGQGNEFLDTMERRKYIVEKPEKIADRRWIAKIETTVRLPFAGLGDVVADVASATGISKIVPKDCGCNKRRVALNKIVPFTQTKG